MFGYVRKTADICISINANTKQKHKAMFRKKLNKTAAKDFALRYAKRDELAKGTCYAIRNGCQVEFYNVGTDTIVSGVVVSNSYGAKTGQHTFTIATDSGSIKIMGRNLYPAIISHKQGAESAAQ